MTRSTSPDPRVLTRRDALRSISVALAAAPFARFIGCNTGAADVAGSDGGAIAASADAGAWATGGTASMTGNYPDPFAAGLGQTCNLSCSATLGPCYAETIERKDISEGQPGLPVRIALLIVDETCTPITNATVDIWHCSPAGLYSGEDASDMCTFGDEGARAARYFRGVQSTDANGRVDFDTCFPGWYSGRTIHIHFTVRVGGAEYVTSQLVFDDALDDEIVASQPIYSSKGARDTLNTNDNVVGGATLTDYTFTATRMDDGAMLASKAIVIRGSTSASLCTLGGSGGSGPP